MTGWQALARAILASGDASASEVRSIYRTRWHHKGVMVYVWMSPDGRADYVGRGSAERARSHRRKPWWTPQHMLLTMACDSEWQAMEYEGKWGALYQPRHNLEGYRYAGA